MSYFATNIPLNGKNGILVDRFSDGTTISSNVIGLVALGSAITVVGSTNVSILNNFVGIGPSSPSNTLAIGSHGVTIDSDSHDITIENNHVGNCNGSGILVDSERAVIRDNMVGFHSADPDVDCGNDGHGIRIGGHVPCAIHGNRYAEFNNSPYTFESPHCHCVQFAESNFRSCSPF